MTDTPTTPVQTYSCPGCEQPVPMGAAICPNPNCKADLTALAEFDLIGNDLYQAAGEQARKGRFSAAIRTLETALLHTPEYVEAWVMKAELHAGLGQHAQAKTCWKQVLELCPDEPRAKAGLIKVEQAEQKKKSEEVKQRRWRRWRTALLGLGVLAVGVLAGYFLTPAPPAGEMRSVSEAIQQAPTLAGLNLKVTEQVNAVELGGTVPDETTRQWVVSLAREVAPDKKITDRLEIPPAENLAAVIETALENNPDIPMEGLVATQKSNVVVLEGELPDEQTLNALLGELTAYPSITVDTSRVKITPVSLVGAVQEALKQAAALSAEEIQIEQNGYGILLKGQVPSLALKSEAERLAGEVKGVEWVDGRALVAIPTLLADRVQQALKADARTADQKWAVEQVEDGVRLSGELERPELPGIAAEIAAGVNGVKLVDTSALSVKWQGKEYTVKEGDSLTLIAQKMYGQWWMWSVIVQANPAQLQDPRDLRVGQVLMIPRMIPALDLGPYRK